MAAYLLGSSASHREGREELLWITDRLGMCSFASLSLLLLKWGAGAIASSTQQRVTGVLEQQLCCNGNKWFESFPICCCSPALCPLCRQKWDWFSLHLQCRLCPSKSPWMLTCTWHCCSLLPAVAAQQAVFQRKPPCSATASLLHSSGWKMFSLMVHQETC